MIELSVGIIGVPFDHGIKLINGRPGARFAPEAIKKEFFRLIKKKKYIDGVKTIDCRNVNPVKNNVKATHERVTSVVKKTIKGGVVPIVLGGGHDITFGSSRAVAQAYKKIGQINIDAHYDVRPVVNGKITSGTPFWRLLESKLLLGSNFVEMGVHSPRCLPEHYKYLTKKKATVIKLDYINKIGIDKSLAKAFLLTDKKTNATVFDIDIDGVQKRFAPGCSAPGIEGFTKKQIIRAAYLAGKNKNVKLFNIMEVSPVYDVKNKTVRLAAELILSFIKGVSKRK